MSNFLSHTVTLLVIKHTITPEHCTNIVPLSDTLYEARQSCVVCVRVRDATASSHTRMVMGRTGKPMAASWQRVSDEGVASRTRTHSSGQPHIACR